MNVAEPEGDSSNLFRQTHNNVEKNKYFNSGVTFLDNSTAYTLQDYMLNRLKNKDRAKGKNSDNMLLNEFILDNYNLFTELDSSWNYMPFLKNSLKIVNPNFFHFVGISGKYFLEYLCKQSTNLQKTLEDLFQQEVKRDK